jgi:hypothetical protein
MAVFGKPLVDLNSKQQTTLLEEIASAAAGQTGDLAGARFFKCIKDLTIRGFYTSRIGLFDELEYRGNATLAKFPGSECAARRNSEER